MARIRSMAQKQLEERVESHEKEMSKIKEMIITLKMSVERFTDEIKENNSDRIREESGCRMVLTTR